MGDIDIFDGYYDEQCLCQEELYGTGNTWIGYDKTHYNINTMAKRHIENCIRMLRRKLIKNEETLEECCYSYIESRIKDLENELDRRGKLNIKEGL